MDPVAAANTAGGFAATATADHHDNDLIYSILELQMDMDRKRIDYSSGLKLFFERIMWELPSCSPEVSAIKLCELLEMF